MFKPTWRWEGGIAFVGAESSGKSTLIKAVQNKISYCNVINELVRGTLKTMNLKTPPAYGCDFDLTAQFQSALQTTRQQVERKHRFFVADRSSVDSLAYTLACCGRDPKSQSWMREFHEHNIAYAKEMYKFFFVVPTGKFPIVPDGVRNVNPYNAFMIHFIILGLLNEYNLPHHVVQSVDIDCRVQEVLEVMQQQGLVAPEGGHRCGK